MSSKTKENGRRSLSSLGWVTCDNCQIIFAKRDKSEHEDCCPSSLGNMNHDFIYENAVYSCPTTCTEQPENILERTLDDMVFVAQPALELCEIPIADRVLITIDRSTIKLVKTVWPLKGGRMIGVAFTEHAQELGNINGAVKVEKFQCPVSTAKEFIISSVGKWIQPSAELDVILKNHNENKIFTVNNKFSVPFYGKKLIYKIDKVIPHKSKTVNLPKEFRQMNLTSPSHDQFYIALYNTKWTILDIEEDDKQEEQKVKYTLEDVGGYDKVIQNIKDVIKIALGLYPTLEYLNNFFVNKGILLYGPAGVGKSTIANALITECGVHAVTIYSSDVYSKTLGETERRLQEIFAEAKAYAPSIVLIEEIDSLCPKRSSSSTDHERRVLSQLIALFDEIQNANRKIAILATTSKLDLVDGSLRRPGRIGKEFEIFVPSPNMRADILKKLLAKMPNSLSEENVTSVAFVTHGFVGADLYGLCSQAILNAVKRHQTSSISTDCSPAVTFFDFERALTVSKPSAMNEVLIELPNVRWSDIGGQKDLKLKLKQAVEWPLRHPEAFSRMGIDPPKGVLMFGPPGCSKTMIAKALATESKVNFLNVKGPELFSKWVGESEKAVREVFRKARQVSPSIVFIDEIDALGGERSSSSNGGSNVQERVLAQLLTELDGVTALGSVTLVAATNRPDKIDKALLRPGRLDRIIYVPLPDYETRQEIFEIKFRSMPIVEDVHIQDLVVLTEGYSGAEIQAICHEAAMKALEEDLNATAITKEHFKAALAIVTPRTPASLINLYDDYMNKDSILARSNFRPLFRIPYPEISQNFLVNKIPSYPGQMSVVVKCDRPYKKEDLRRMIECCGCCPPQEPYCPPICDPCPQPVCAYTCQPRPCKPPPCPMFPPPCPLPPRIPCCPPLCIPPPPPVCCPPCPPPVCCPPACPPVNCCPPSCPPPSCSPCVPPIPLTCMPCPPQPCLLPCAPRPYVCPPCTGHPCITCAPLPKPVPAPFELGPVYRAPITTGGLFYTGTVRVPCVPYAGCC